VTVSASSVVSPVNRPSSLDAFGATQRAAPRLVGAGVALPSLRRAQTELCDEIGALLELRGAALARWQRIWRGSGIEGRHAVAPPSSVIGATTAERMRLFNLHAAPLAADAARAALRDACVDPARVTDLVVVTCTGFSAPGVPRQMIDQLGLRSSVRSSQIGFMGCFGGVCGLRAAAAHASADPDAVVLLVCVELCSLHLRLDRDPENLVASALFGDGAAAAVVACESATDSPDCESRETDRAFQIAPIIRPGRSLTVAGTLDAMSWTITDHGFAMTLSREVPEALSRELAALVGPSREVLIHPGGPSIIDAAESALAPSQCGAIEHSRSVLRDYGNMSSASILFVLERWRRAAKSASPALDPAALVAFGPGLTIDVVTLEAE